MSEEAEIEATQKALAYLAQMIADNQAVEIYAPRMRFSVHPDTFNIDVYSLEGVKRYVIRIPMREMIRHIDDWKVAVDTYKEHFHPTDDQTAQEQLGKFYDQLGKRLSKNG